VLASVINTGYMDTMPEATMQTGAYSPVLAEITAPAGASVVQGLKRAKYSPIVEQIRDIRPGQLKRSPARVDLGIITGGSEQLVEWLVVAPEHAKISIRVRSEKAGEDSREVELK
jgi:hypothetical protein